MYHQIILLLLIFGIPVYGQSFVSDSVGIYYAQAIEEELFSDIELELTVNQKIVLEKRLISIYKQLLKDFPGSTYKLFILNRLGSLYLQKDHLKSKEYNNRVIHSNEIFYLSHTKRLFLESNSKPLVFNVTITEKTLKHNSFLNLARISLEEQKYNQALTFLDSCKSYPEDFESDVKTLVPHLNERIKSLYGLGEYKELDLLLNSSYLYSFFIPSEYEEIIYETIIRTYEKPYIISNILEPIKHLSIKKSYFYGVIDINFMNEKNTIDLVYLSAENLVYEKYLKEESTENFYSFAKRVIKDRKKSTLYQKLKKYTTHNSN
ncbi:hypothetical protein [Flammeovirga pacifica]|uniref:Uncharacterized protein n=1 Tax=Flammeovirga pacifica TaxID=915059 RepID=A0A1S1Z5M0_FLAPC|nr:hypothetical protein [Flammeovirga pacifica]OHX68375.1 hypothetical protein NH26_19480 [Flammeovirga pacifica]